MILKLPISFPPPCSDTSTVLKHYQYLALNRPPNSDLLFWEFFLLVEHLCMPTYGGPSTYHGTGGQNILDSICVVNGDSHRATRQGLDRQIITDQITACECESNQESQELEWLFMYVKCNHAHDTCSIIEVNMK